MKLFFDTEFTGLHKDTSLISIGVVTETNLEFYAEFWNYDRAQINDWLWENVLRHLKFKKEVESLENKKFHGGEPRLVEVCGNKFFVREVLSEWLEGLQEPIELVSDVCYFDMVLFIGIFGDAFSLPENVSPTCHDINQDIAAYLGVYEGEAFDVNREEFAGIPEAERGTKHNALWDAKAIKMCYKRLWERLL